MYLGIESSLSGRRWVGPDAAVTRAADVISQGADVAPGGKPRNMSVYVDGPEKQILSAGTVVVQVSLILRLYKTMLKTW